FGADCNPLLMILAESASMRGATPQSLLGVSGRACTPNHCGVLGHCPTPEPEKRTTFNTRHFGAVIAPYIASNNLDRPPTSRVGYLRTGREDIPLGLLFFSCRQNRPTIRLNL